MRKDAQIMMHSMQHINKGLKVDRDIKPFITSGVCRAKGSLVLLQDEERVLS